MVALRTDGFRLDFTKQPDCELLFLYEMSPKTSKLLVAVDEEQDEEELGSTVEQARAFSTAVAQQLEPLLLLAHSLKLEPLQQRLAACVAACSLCKTSTLFGFLEHVFTDRVLAAALPPSATESDKMAFIEQVLTFRCFAEYDGTRQLLEVHAGPAGCVMFAINSWQTFSATLTRDSMGSTGAGWM